IERIGDNAFSGCASMSNFTFSKVKHIGSYAFANCLGVTSLVIPETVEYMGQGMLEEMRMNLKHLTVPFVGETADSKNGTLAYWMPYSGMTIELESVVITNATKIANGAFKEINSLKSITLNDKIEYIGSQAFYNCVALTNVKLPAQLFEIGESAFENCVQYQFNKLPDTLNRIGKYAFKDTAVQGVLELPASLTSMNFSFASRYGQITKINSRNYRQIQTYEMFDAGITNDQMPEIVYGYENSIYTNDNGDEFYYSVNNDGTVTITKYVGSYDVVIPENINGKVVRDIGVTFRYDSYNSIVVPSGVTRLYSHSLDFNSYLETITLSDGSLKFIGANAFTSNSSITHYVIPESVEVIENFAFQGSNTNLIIYLKHSEIPDTFGEYWNSKDESGDYNVKYTVYCYGDPNDGSLPSGTYWYYDEVGQIKVYSR
ncbi:MAG: leucine-rich repeat protein, partial [Clostridia bacterium]|nr:leucine-rich repeat protein [Clostridia bacterium]